MRTSKISHQIFIIIFVALTLFIVKDELVDFYNKHIKKQEQTIKANIEQQTEVIKVAKLIEAPGALLVLDDISVIRKNNILSSENIITLTNKQRLNNGNLTGLKENLQLSFLAEKKLEDMFTNQYFEHLSPEGLGVSDLADQLSHDYIIIGENLAMGNFKNDQTLVNAWMASPGHRANILNEHYSEIGVAVDKKIFQGKEIWIAVQHFSLPLEFCPLIDKILHGEINYRQEQIIEYEKDLSIRLENINSGVVSEGKTTNEQINFYNEKIIDYNKLIVEAKEKIIKYNKQVSDFNECLLENTEQ